jgi:hypothetical protein
MSTPRQLAANRRNALKSTGPTSPAGKAASSMNAVKTGLYAKCDLLPSEDAAVYRDLINRYYADYAPADSTEAHYVDDLIYCEWNIRRLRAAERQTYTVVFNGTYKGDEDLIYGEAAFARPEAFARLQWRIDSTRRAYNSSLKLLQELQATRAKKPPEPTPPSPTIETPSPEIGFVPSPPPEPPSMPPTPLPPVPPTRLQVSPPSPGVQSEDPLGPFC